MAGGTSGTVGSTAVAPTSWIFINTGSGGTVTYASALSGSGNSIRMAGASVRPGIAQNVTLIFGENYSFSYNIETVTSAGNLLLGSLWLLLSATVTATYYVNGVLASYSTVPTSNSRVQVVFNMSSATGSYQLRWGIGIDGVYTGDITLSNPQIEIGSVLNSYVPTTTTAVYGTPTLSFSGVSTIGLQNDGALFVQPAGTGALQAQATTSSATGGNARGANAVDWQTSRTAATMVASTQAVISGGQNNTASGTASSALGGYTNLVNANYATAVGGSYGTTRGVIGLVSIPASNQPLNVTTAGSTQSSMLVIGVQTTNATATALKSNTSAASATNQLVLPNGQTSTVSVYTFRALVSAHNTGTTDAAGWEIKGVISRGAAAANTALVGTPSVALLGATSGAISAGWGVVGAVAAVADTTNGALQIQVTGTASTTINWSATIETNELGY